MSSTVTVQVPNEAIQVLGEPDLSREILVAAALRWFEEGRLSQGEAATMLGMTRAEFFELLNQRRVSPIQMSIDDLEEDFRRG
jgi:predicted HTH domain antitoxin